MSQENLHKGHRKRMKDKADGCSALYDHEILELLLFTAQPRVNTNPAAHALLDRFGTLKGVFSASTEELKTVKGIGDSSANLIRVVGEISRRMGSTVGVAVLKNTEDCKKFISIISARAVKSNVLYPLRRQTGTGCQPTREAF